MFLTAVAALLWIAALSLPDGKLRVTFLDVGPGDATLIVTPAGQQVLVDGGADPLEAVRALGKRLPFWDKSLDLVVLSHPHEDHVNGLLEVLRRYKVGHILERAQQYETPSYLAWHQLIREKGIPVTQARQGQRVALAGGVSLEVLWPTERLLQGTPSDINNGSVVARLVYRDVSFLLTGDIEEEAEGRLVSQGVPLSSAVLKVAHQGSRTSTLESFLKRVSPIASVIFTQENSRFGHPHPETLEALQKYVPARNIFLTREHGSLQFITDGTRLEVEVER